MGAIKIRNFIPWSFIFLLAKSGEFEVFTPHRKFESTDADSEYSALNAIFCRGCSTLMMTIQDIYICIKQCGNSSERSALCRRTLVPKAFFNWECDVGVVGEV